MTEEEKAPYNKLAKADDERYQKQMAQYKDKKWFTMDDGSKSTDEKNQHLFKRKTMKSKAADKSQGKSKLMNKSKASAKPEGKAEGAKSEKKSKVSLTPRRSTGGKKKQETEAAESVESDDS